MHPRRACLAVAIVVSVCGAANAAQQTRPSAAPGQTNGRTAVSRFDVEPASISFGAVQSGVPTQRTITLSNLGWSPVLLQRVSFLLGGAGNSEWFSMDIGGTVYSGSTNDVTYVVSATIQPAAVVDAVLTYLPLEERYDSILVRFETSAGTFDVPVDALGGHEGDPFLHVVIDAPDFVVDYDGDGLEDVPLDGSTSHTHEPGRAIVLYEWDDGTGVFSTDPITTRSLGIGQHEITLTITDDDTPPDSLSGSVMVNVYDQANVPGVVGFYYDARGGSASVLLDDPPAQPDFAEALPDFFLPAKITVGSSLLHEDVMVQLVANIDVPVAGTYRFVASGGVDRRVFLGGFDRIRRASIPPNPAFLPAGKYRVDARFAINEAFEDMPISLSMGVDGGPLQPIDAASLSFDAGSLLPVVNSMPFFGTEVGGNLITIQGFGFYPSSSVVVHWGGIDLDQNDFQLLSPTRIEFLSPPGTGNIAVTVETAQGVSNEKSFTYSPSGPVPINFVQVQNIIVYQPTAGVWGPDGGFYVVTRTGHVHEMHFDSAYNLVSHVVHPGVSGLTNHEALGITVDPYDPPAPLKLYVAHAQLFANGGSSFTGPSAYTGQVSVLTGPDFDDPVPLITGLPTSNHDHGVNGMVFDNNGDLLIAMGGNTNAGVKHPNSGDLPESPLTGAILKAHTSKPGFNGTITYVETDSGLPNDDQVFGDIVDVAPGVDVEVHASGVRNGFDLVMTTSGHLYATDNGPNFGFGAASTGPTTEGPHPQDEDELLLIEYGNYYGHPNRNRGRYDPRQNVYYGSLTGPQSIPEVFTQMISTLSASSDGLDEYRSNTFQGQLRGQLFVQEWIDDLRRVELRPDGRGTITQTIVPPFTGALSVRAGPGGGLFVLDYATGRVKVLRPDDLSAVGLVVHDIFPWRSPANYNAPFMISGVGFGDMADTTVTIGGNPATLTFVGPKLIRGQLPIVSSPTPALLDVVVTVGGSQATLPEAFRYLIGPGQEPGRWESLPSIPDPLGEVSAGVIDGVLYVVGEGSPATYAYDLLNGIWLSNRMNRLHVGHHHAAEVIDGKLYLFGGLNGGSEGTVQIYDPVADSWSEGAPMTWAGGSISTCSIDGLVYAAGGIVGGSTVANCAVYDPVADSWSPLAPMPAGRNHAAAATDGQRFFVFGGRIFGNFVTNGFDTVQIYDPATDTWESSDDVGSTLAPLPQYRGGMGKAVFYRGEFYAFGGETNDGPGATAAHVYDRVDVYDPVANTWRAEAPMPNPRHGLFPVLFQSRMFLAGGGLQAGSGQSTVFDVFTRQ